MEIQLEGEAVRTFKKERPGTRRPGSVHAIARNASKLQTAKLLFFYVMEPGKVRRPK